MLFLSETEKANWSRLGRDLLANESSPIDVSGDVRANLIPPFHFFMGTLLTANGHAEPGTGWFREGLMREEEGLFSNTFLSSFLERHDGRFVMPNVAFVDPRPFVHFTTVPAIKDSRQRFIEQCGHSLPAFSDGFRIIDIGCGNGALVCALLQHLREVGKIDEVAEILLVDASQAMVDLAAGTVGKVFPQSSVSTVHSKIEEFSNKIDRRFDVALSSLAYHHLPIDQKLAHLEVLRQWCDHFVIFELDANHDTPEMHSPELLLSVYQSYGRVIDFVFAHDAEVEVVLACVDRFLMTEELSLLTQPRGVRTEYHMLRTQWHEALQEGLGREFACLCDSSAYADEHFVLFTMHYGR